jgi:threonylcarbamoyladenosine tRNA methylthiotransferase MtaB
VKVYLQSLGCRLNQSEIDGMARQFAEAGHLVVNEAGRADVCILNTCAVTAEAGRKSRRRIRALARLNPDARIAAVGCYSTLAPESCAALPGVEWVLLNDDKERAVEITGGRFQVSGPRSPIPSPRTRAFVKVQDGCDNRCTYCVVRLLRGPSRSRPLTEVVAEVRSLVDGGCQEAVLTGVNLGAYGRDLEQTGGLRALIEALLARTDLPRLRLSSLEPWDVDERLLQLWEESRLCRQIHLPLQAGCDETLRRMGRRIDTATYAKLVEAARTAVPDMAVTTDVIVGFPGEDDVAFRASYDLLAALDLARLHVFSFSPRQGTPAARLPGRVGRAEIHERACTMRDLGDEQARRFRRRFLGREMTVLWQRRQRDGLWVGLTDNYLRVVTRSERDLHNRLMVTRLARVEGECLAGEVVG